jgi:hypothetical protein
LDEEKHSADNSQHGYEQQDTNAKHLLLYGATLVVLVVCSLVAMDWLFRFYVSRQPSLSASSRRIRPCSTAMVGSAARTASSVCQLTAPLTCSPSAACPPGSKTHPASTRK